MPDIATVLKAEIIRLARKELKAETAEIRKALGASRTEISSLRKRVGELESSLKRATRAATKREPAPAMESPESPDGLRFRLAGMASNRKRLGLSAADFGLLVGATGQSVYAWEGGKSKPSSKSLVAIAALRNIGRREVESRLGALKV
jgi:DNA-binding transcriptional regulator YiaG